MPKLPPLAKETKARNDHQARSRFKLPLSQALASVSREQWERLSPAGGQGEEVLWVETPLRTAGQLSTLFFRSTIRYRFVDDPRPGREGQRKVETLSYAHTYSEDADHSPELVSWHWHPGTRDVPFPHLHVGKGAAWLAHPDLNIAKLHIPTARVAFEEVLLFGLRDLAVQPINSNTTVDACITKIEESLATFMKYRTWP